MQSIDNSEAWKQIPPEEKLEIMSRAHATGFFAAVVAVVVCSTIALALKISTIMWASIVLSPLVFQFASGKAWKGLKPRIMLEYLAARSVVRRFAFAEGAKDLHLNLIFRGKLENIFENDAIQEALEAVVSRTKEASVWIALFPDALIMITERPGGAVLAMGHLVNDKLTIQSSDNGNYTNGKELTIVAKDRKAGAVKKYKITSRHPGALAVLEKRILQFQEESKQRMAREVAAITNTVDVPTDDNDFVTHSSF